MIPYAKIFLGEYEKIRIFDFRKAYWLFETETDFLVSTDAPYSPKGIFEACSVERWNFNKLVEIDEEHFLISTGHNAVVLLSKRNQKTFFRTLCFCQRMPSTLDPKATKTTSCLRKYVFH